MLIGSGQSQSVSSLGLAEQPLPRTTEISADTATAEAVTEDKGINELLPLAGIELIKQFTRCSLQVYANPVKQTGTPKYLAGWESEGHLDGEPFAKDEWITQTQANQLLRVHLTKNSLPVLQALPNWQSLNEHQQGALLSFAHSLGNDESVLSPRSLLGRALAHRRWYQIPTIIRGYHGHNPPDYIAYRRQEEAQLFLLEIRRDSYTVINRSRLLFLSDPVLTGQDVRSLQSVLVQKGYEIDIDGTFGPLTQWAVEKFQALAAMPVTGIADVATQRVLYARALFMSDPYIIGSDVREVQSALARMGYAVDVTGVFNLRTLHAVMAFQRYFDLPEDGIVKDETLAKLLYLPAMATVS